MKNRSLIVFTLVLVSLSAFSQTPYDIYAPEQKEKHINELGKEDYLMENPDITSFVRFVAIDWNKFSYSLFDKDGNVLSVGVLSDTDKKFISPDKHCEKYTSTTPYVYCQGDPISYADPNGMDTAILLVDDTPVGHLALLIQNEGGEWLYYSINGVESSSGASDRNDIAIAGNWDDPQEFLNMTNRVSVDNDPKSNQNLNLYNYTEAYLINTTTEQDIIISNTFTNYSNTQYDPISNNCATIVQNSLISGGLDKIGVTITLPGSSNFGGYGISFNTVLPRPHDAFKNIMKAYNGVYFKK